jgi:hypothetical protein
MLMPTIPGSFAELLGAFRVCFTAPTFTTFTALCAGLLAQPGPGTVCGMLAGARLAGIWHHARAHRFFTSARWRADHLGLLLCDLIVDRLLEADAPILLAVDDTLFHRASRRLPLAAFHHDPTAPAGRRIGWGHCWVVVGILVRLPFIGHRQVCLPVLARLWHPRDRDHTKLVLAHQMIRLVAARHPNRQLQVVADAAYAGSSPLGLPARVTLTTRLRRDAALHGLPAARQPSQRGRPRRKGDRLPTLERLADLPTTIWQPATVRRYGKTTTVTLTTVTCLWYHVHRARPCGSCWSARPTTNVASTWPLCRPTSRPPRPSWSNGMRPGGQSRSRSWRASTWSGWARPATAAAARSSAPCRSGWSPTACWWSGTPSTDMPSATSPPGARARPGTATRAPPPPWTCWWRSAARCSSNITAVTQLSPPAQNCSTRY